MEKHSNLSPKQKAHLRELWEQYPLSQWQNKNGAPTKEAIVKEYRDAHPHASKRACAKETGLSINTIRKWWN